MQNKTQAKEKRLKKIPMMSDDRERIENVRISLKILILLTIMNDIGIRKDDSWVKWQLGKNKNLNNSNNKKQRN